MQAIPSPYAAEQTTSHSTTLSRKEFDLRSALNAEPSSPEVAYALALTLREEGKAHESIDMYTRAAALRKPSTAELRSVALDYVLLSDYDDAIHWLEIAAKIDPKDANVLYSLGRCYYTRTRYEEAGKLYQQVLALHPHDVKAEENLGLVFDAINELDRAEPALRAAAEWAGDKSQDEWPFVDLGAFLLDRNRAEEALAPLRTAVQIRPACAICHEKLGRALLATRDSTGGIAELETSTRLEPDNPKTHFELGRALRQAGQIEKAKQELAVSQKLYTTHSQE
jgi:tetratricopeptide (TPR) repeat protein